MSDEIVTRLRDKHGEFRALVGVNQTVIIDTIYGEAADEIERLREWKELAYEMRNKYWWIMRWKTLKKFDAMHEADWNLPKNVELKKLLNEGFGK